MRRKRRIFQHSNTQGYPLREHIDRKREFLHTESRIGWNEGEVCAHRGNRTDRRWAVTGKMECRRRQARSDHDVDALAFICAA